MMVEWEFPLLLEVRRKRVREGKQNKIKGKEIKRKQKKEKGERNAMQAAKSNKRSYLLFVVCVRFCPLCFVLCVFDFCGW